MRLRFYTWYKKLQHIFFLCVTANIRNTIKLENLRGDAFFDYVTNYYTTFHEFTKTSLNKTLIVAYVDGLYTELKTKVARAPLDVIEWYDESKEWFWQGLAYRGTLSPEEEKYKFYRAIDPVTVHPVSINKYNFYFLASFLYTFIKTTVVSLSVGLLTFLYLVYFFQLQFLKQLAIWFVILNLVFWLFSGFNFFLKRYKFGKFTSAIQRFWKRTNMCFWLIEGFLFMLFFYYFLNSSQEPLYMYDVASLNQEYLLPLPSAYVNSINLAIIIYILSYLMLALASQTYMQTVVTLIFVSTYIFFAFFLESYQFYYVISTFSESFWSFSDESGVWELENENIRLRTKQYYFLLCLIAKYWHFVFIFLSWVFFIIKSLELKKITFNLLALNIQNLIILYVLNILCYLQWLKWATRRFLDLPYEWFFSAPSMDLFTLLSSEITLFFSSCLIV